MHEKMGGHYGKVWGSTRCLFRKNNVEIHRIEIQEGGYCSIHKHRNKHNAFYVERGRLVIRVWKDDLSDEIILTEGQYTSVDPGNFHQFEGLSDCIVYEIYWTELDADDIERNSIGGLATDEELN